MVCDNVWPAKLVKERELELVKSLVEAVPMFALPRPSLCTKPGRGDGVPFCCPAIDKAFVKWMGFVTLMSLNPLEEALVVELSIVVPVSSIANTPTWVAVPTVYVRVRVTEAPPTRDEQK